MPSNMNRRHCLKTVGKGLSLLYPIFHGIKLSAQTIGPKRLIIIQTPLGTVRESWVPTGVGANFTLNAIHQPLLPYKDKLLILDGIKILKEHYTGNHKETGSLLTGTACEGRDSQSKHTNVSLDQFLASKPEIRGGTPLASLCLAAWDHKSWLDRADRRFLSAKGPNLKVDPYADPHSAYTAVFDGIPLPKVPPGERPPPGESAPSGDGTLPDLEKGRTSVFDAIVRDIKSMQNGLAASEKAKLDQHVTSIRELELQFKRTQGLTLASTGCQQLDEPGNIQGDNASLPLRLKAHLDIMISAINCDLTRIGVIAIEGGSSYATHNWLGINQGFHEHSHSTDFQLHTAINTWHAEQVKYLLDGLSASREGNGSVLDNCAVLWISEQGSRGPAAKSHARDNVPCLIAGGLGGAIKTGRVLNFAQISHRKVLTALMNGMGISGNSFGAVTEDPLNIG
jgi:hypothetical protein